MTAFEHPLDQGAISLRVLQRIKDALINKELRPGDYLPTEVELTQKLGVSKTSVREAVKMLQALGVVEVTRRHGTRVCQHPIESMLDPLIFQLILEYENPKDLVELRMMFEPAFTILAMKKAGPEDLENIRQAMEQFETAVQAGTYRADKDVAFHVAILASTHNPLVMRIGETIYQLFQASIQKALTTDYQQAIVYHRNIFTAFCEQNEPALLQALDASFSQWGHTIEADQPQPVS